MPYWKEVATTLAVKYHRTERETAHLLALINMVAFDGLVASHEAKFFYWLLRPTMADPGITLAIPLNFPSYPSNHAVLSSGIARILGASFPAERDRLDALAQEAAICQIYGGIHYRFDADAGLVLGRRVAAWALRARRQRSRAVRVAVMLDAGGTHVVESHTLQQVRFN